MPDIFPFNKIRPGQKEMLEDVREAFSLGKHIVAHAPTGIGKTAATVVPAVEACLGGKTAFFLTPKHAQHRIVIDTLKLMKAEVVAVDFIGKKWMCPFPGARELSSKDFQEYCSSLRKDEICTFYNATVKGGKLSSEARAKVEELLEKQPLHVEDACDLCGGELCPYEIMCAVGKKASFVICDYYHIFNPGIRASFLHRLGKELDNSVLIVDEAQNLPQRIREMMSERISEITARKAAKEAKNYGFDILVNELKGLYHAIEYAGRDVDEEKILGKEKFISTVESFCTLGFENLANNLEEAGNAIREKQRKSSCGAISKFMKSWLGQDEGYVRTVSRFIWKDKAFLTVKYKCLDPSFSSKELADSASSVVLMSGTLSPMKMYADILGFTSDRTVMKQYTSSFPKGNRLNIIVPTVTTKFTSRSPDEFQKIAKICSESAALIPGNTAIFFPSYKIKDVIKTMLDLKGAVPLEENRGMTKKEKGQLLREFGTDDRRKVLLGVASGSFSEGVDYAKNILKCVIVVGLPLEQPSLEVQSLIAYYDKKFGRGWDYGYTFPAMSRAMQAGGRCIRSEKDRAVVLFLDKRYTWQNYMRCFPTDLNVTVAAEPLEKIEQFWKGG